MPMKRPKKFNRLTRFKTTGLVVVAAATIGGFLGISFKGNKPFYVPSYRAVRVIDGDTFITAEDQNIRLASSDAPELDRCGGQQAKKELEKLILNKDIYLKVVYRDSSRLMALVYAEDGLVDEKMLASGWAEIHNREGVNSAQLTAAAEKARQTKLGVFSDLCTQTVNPQHSDCRIKGNIKLNTAASQNAVEKTYYFPGCNSYDIVVVQLHKGDAWFCTEAEARQAGFIKAVNCPVSYK